MPNVTVSANIDSFMKAADNAAARTSLGLGTAATQASSAFDAAGAASTAQAAAIAASAQRASNLADVASAPTALSNLGVGVPVAVGTNRVLTNADNGKDLVCSGTPQITINTGLISGFGVLIKGAFTYTGTATVTDERTPLATYLTAVFVQTGTDTYSLVGQKA